MPHGPSRSLSFLLLSSTTSRLKSDPIKRHLSIQTQDYITQTTPHPKSHLRFSHQHSSQSKPFITPNTITILSSPPTPIPTGTSTMPSSSTTKTSKTYAPSVASTSTTASYTKSSKSESSSKRSAILNGAKRLLSDIGSPPTAAYDRQQAAKGEQSKSQKVFYMPNQMPPRT